MNLQKIDQSNNPGSQDLNRFLHAGFILILILIFIIGVYGGMFKISGAVLANGTVVLESNTKDVQHKEGGIISEILIKEGDDVKQNQILVRLDTTIVKANLATIYKEIGELSARRSRLIAERDDLESIPIFMISPDFNSSFFRESLDTERQFFIQRRSLKIQQIDRLNQQIESYESQNLALEDQITSVKKQKSLLKEELISHHELYKNKVVTLTLLNSIEIKILELDGEQAQLEGVMSEVNARISQTQVQLLQLDTSMSSEVMAELKDTEVALAQLKAKRITDEDLLHRLDIISPADGKLQELRIHTKGGVVVPSETLMRIVPNKDSLIVEAMIESKSIGQVKIGQEARIRFVSFNTSTTPILKTQVDRISSDVVLGDEKKASFYRARLKVGSDLPIILQGNLISGMPVEVQITTDRRTPLSYILKPLTDQMARSFK